MADLDGATQPCWVQSTSKGWLFSSFLRHPRRLMGWFNETSIWKTMVSPQAIRAWTLPWGICSTHHQNLFKHRWPWRGDATINATNRSTAHTCKLHFSPDRPVHLQHYFTETENHKSMKQNVVTLLARSSHPNRSDSYSIVLVFSVIAHDHSETKYAWVVELFRGRQTVRTPDTNLRWSPRGDIWASTVVSGWRHATACLSHSFQGWPITAEPNHPKGNRFIWLQSLSCVPPRVGMYLDTIKMTVEIEAGIASKAGPRLWCHRIWAVNSSNSS